MINMADEVPDFRVNEVWADADGTLLAVLDGGPEPRFLAFGSSAALSLNELTGPDRPARLIFDHLGYYKGGSGSLYSAGAIGRIIAAAEESRQG